MTEGKSRLVHTGGSVILARSLLRFLVKAFGWAALTQVAATATRRRLMLAHRRKIFTLATALPAGESGALLRSQGLCQFPEPGARLSDVDRLVAGQGSHLEEPRMERRASAKREAEAQHATSGIQASLIETRNSVHQVRSCFGWERRP